MKGLVFKAVKLYARPLATRFHAALVNPQAAQEGTLQSIVDDLKLTSYGKHLGVRCVDTFKRKVPIVTYDDLAPWVKKQQRCEMNVLVNGKVEFYEKTSGSTGPSKYIPYTKALRSSFSRMFLIWAYDIIENIPNMGSGKLYFSVSPSFDEETMTEGGVPVGLDDDADYLGTHLKWVLSPFLLMPDGVSSIRNPEDFKKAVSIALIEEEQLESISIWNPSFLRVLMDWVCEHQEELIEHCRGKLTPPRLDALSAKPISWSKLWPNLKFISTWADAHAKPLAQKLREEFPGVEVQGKGLLATEAPLTIPMIGVEGGVPLVNEVYFEFLAENSRLIELHELELGETYEIIISQRGGLVRYRLGDYIRVVSHTENTPTFEFVGRGNKVSDLVGEKLNEAFIKDVLDQMPETGDGFQCLMPARIPEDGYILVSDTLDVSANTIAENLEERLCEAFHYRHARALGQLLPVRAVCEPRIESLLSEFYIRSGKRWGDMKSSYLLTTPIDSHLLGELGLVDSGRGGA